VLFNICYVHKAVCTNIQSFCCSSVA
jgi:hypothetical protein